MLRTVSSNICCQFCQRFYIGGTVSYHRSYVSSTPFNRERKRTTDHRGDHRKSSGPQDRRAALRSSSATPSWKLKTPKQKKTIEEIVTPVNYKYPIAGTDHVDIGKELAGQINKDSLIKVLNLFPIRPNLRKLCAESGVTERLFNQAFMSFRKFCLEHSPLPVELHILFCDLAKGKGHVDDLYPHFLQHARNVYPHLQFMEELKKISDLRLPQNWYPEARNIQRKFIFHAGPTNSGKTYQALERFYSAKSGVYCGPLKLLASEVYYKTNLVGTPCDLITGEERLFALSREEPSRHVASTIEMLNTTTPYEVAIIDEIQMLRDIQRGWAWTRALLGVCAEEVHLCGEYAAIEVIKQLLYPIGEEVEIRNYKRMTPLKLSDQPVSSFNNVKPGDCIVAFTKNDIYQISRQVEKKGHEVAVIYGGLPPGTKLAQAKKFNDPDDKCKIMVATDAIGMGLNLSIKRIVFWSTKKTQLMENGEKFVELLSTSQALQIAGRAGRFGTQFADGEVTTFKEEDLHVLKKLLSDKVPDIETAGLYPTFEQIEMFAYYLPSASLSNLVDIFISLCAVDEAKYFICNMDDFKMLAEMIEHIKEISLKARYVFCLAPINLKSPFVCSQFLKFARRFSTGEPLSFEWMSSSIGWPFCKPQTTIDLIHLEGVFDVMEMYLWLGYRFVDMFPDMELVRDMQKEIDMLIKEGVANITALLNQNETSTSSRIGDPDHEEFSRRMKTEEYLKHGDKSSRESKVDAKRKDAGESETTNPTLTRRLIEQGVLTRDMVTRLEKEFRLKESKNTRKKDEDKNKN